MELRKNKLLLIFVLFTTSVHVLAETYYVTPVSSIPCPNKSIPCFTLTQYAAKPNSYFTSTTTLILLPGKHSLNSELSITNIKSLELVTTNKSSFPSETVTVIICSFSAMLNFELIEQIQISGITYVGCVNNNIIKSNKFFLDNCNLQGQGCNGTGFRLKNVSVVKIVRSSFSSNTGLKVYNSIGSVLRGGGALSVTNCGSVSIVNSTFINNTVTNGESGSSIHDNTTINNYTTFTSNSVASSIGIGGAVLFYDSTIAIINSTFTNNYVNGSDYGRGGGMAAIDCNISITNSVFHNNFVSEAFVIGTGGAVYIEGGTVNVNTSVFTNNQVTNSDIGAGGALVIKGSTITVTNSSFTNNCVTGDIVDARGGALYTEYSAIFISHSAFMNNYIASSDAVATGGAVATLDSTVTITDNVFSNNFETCDEGSGGALYAEHSTILIINGKFINNYVAGSESDGISIGGAVGTIGSAVNITSNAFTNNFVTGYEGRGGALYSEHGDIHVANSTFKSNYITGHYGGLGGAMAAYRCLTTLTSSSFIMNYLIGNDGLGGAVYALIYIINIVNSTFTDNHVTGNNGGGGAIAAASNIIVTFSNFTNNTVTIVNGGGGAVTVEIGTLNIISSTFTNNSVTANDTAGGGAVSVQDTALNVTIASSMFAYNIVDGEFGFGGAVHVSSDHFLNITGSIFVHNYVIKGAGGAVFIQNTTSASINTANFLYNVCITGIVYVVRSTVHFYGNITISNNYGSVFAFSSNITFTGQTNINYNSPLKLVNTSTLTEEGGAVTGYQSNIIFSGLVSLQYNTAKHGGALLLAESKLYTHSGIIIAQNRASFSGGGIYAYHSELNFNGKIYITRNTANVTGGGVEAIGSTTRIIGASVHFINNSANKGGGMSLTLNGKLYIINSNSDSFLDCKNSFSEYCNLLEFTDNFAEWGGALYVSDDTNSGTCKATSTGDSSLTSECFFQALGSEPFLFINPSLDTVNFYFINNSATVAGGSLYGGLIDRCTISPVAEIFGKNMYLTPRSLSAISYILDTTNLTPQDFNSKAKISSDPVRVCFCKDSQPDCNYYPQTVDVKKGQTFTVILVAVDHVNNTIPNSSIHGSLSQHAGIGEGQSIQQTNMNGSCTELKYNVYSANNSEQLHLDLYADGPCMGLGISTAILTINIVGCPIGFQDTHFSCDCDPNLESDYVSNCSIDNESVLRKDNVWFDYVNNTKHQAYILYRHCPFDYCRSSSEKVDVNLNVPNGANALCAFNRSGKLCGSCEVGLSLSLGSSRCMSCSNIWLALIPVFVIAGIALLGVIYFLNLTVVTGTLNGLILYANVIAANRAILLPISKTNLLTVFIAWLNLDFGFQCCFYDGLNGYVKVWLQLVFPTCIICFVFMVVVLANRSYRFNRIHRVLDRNPLEILATLIFLSYTKFLRILIAALSFATLQYSDGFQERVWLYDANIPYLAGKHIALFVVALLILLLGSIYTFLLLFWQCLNRCPQKRPLVWITGDTRIIAFMHVYHAPYNDKNRYWTGLLLLIRVVLYLISSLNGVNDPRINLVFIIICLALSLFVLNNPFKIVYSSTVINVLESSYMINLIIFAAVSLYSIDSKGNQAALAYTSTGIAFITFFVTISYHMYRFVIKKALKKYFPRFVFNKREDSFEPVVDSILPDDYEPTVSVIDVPDTENTSNNLMEIAEHRGVQDTKPENECGSSIQLAVCHNSCSDNNSTNPVQHNYVVGTTSSFGTETVDAEVELHNLATVNQPYDTHRDAQNLIMSEDLNNEACKCEDESTPLLQTF